MGKTGKVIKIFNRQQRTVDANNELAGSFARLQIQHLSNQQAVKFEDMGLRKELMKGILAYGLERPAGIQQRAILPCIAGKDIIMQAQSGMGKTAAAVIGILQKLNTDKRSQVLVLAPTRELAAQIKKVISDIGKYIPGFTCYGCIGGRSLKRDRAVLTGLNSPHVIVGTLGRIVHLISLKDLNPELIEVFLLDEADIMLSDLSFRKDMKTVIAALPAATQIILMSATMPEKDLALAKSITVDPAIFTVNNHELTLDGIRQYYIQVETDEQKLNVLLDLEEIFAAKVGLIFCNSKKRAKDLRRKLQDKYKDTEVMQGDMEQIDRDGIVNGFSIGTNKKLITSDVLGRGVDFQQVSLVVNYDIPRTAEQYIHRIGRAGRFGRKGVAITIIASEECIHMIGRAKRKDLISVIKGAELEHLKKIEEFYQTEIPKMPTNIARILQEN